MSATDPTPADIAQFLVPGEQCVIAVMEGEQYPCPHAEVHQPGSEWCDAVPLCTDGIISSRPAVAEAECLECKGRTRYENDGWECPNPLCRDGDLLHELRVECYLGCGKRLGLPRSDPRAMPCDCRDGYRTVPARIEVVPVRMTGDVIDEWSRNCWSRCLALAHNWTAALVTGIEQWERLDPARVAALEAHHGPAAGWVGKWAIVATAVER